jgi:hypothetical protein
VLLLLLRIQDLAQFPASCLARTVLKAVVVALLPAMRIALDLMQPSVLPHFAQISNKGLAALAPTLANPLTAGDSCVALLKHKLHTHTYKPHENFHGSQFTIT